VAWRRPAKVALGLAVSAVALYLAVRRVHWPDFAHALAHVEPRYVAYTALVMMANLLVRARRWQLLLRPVTPARWVRDSFTCYAIAYMANMLLPLRPGEVLRPYLLGRKLGVEKTPLFATVLLERLWDMAFLAGLFLVAVAVSGAAMPEAVRRGVLAGGGGGAALLAAMWLVMASPRVKDSAVALVRRVPGPAGQLAHRLGQTAALGVRTLRHPGLSARVVVLPGGVWLCSYLMAASCIAAFGLDLPWHVALFATVIANFGMMVPSSPGAIGVAHALYVFALSLFGVGASVALGVAVVLHGVGYLVVIAAGMVALGMEGMHFAQVRQAAAPPAE